MKSNVQRRRSLIPFVLFGSCFGLAVAGSWSLAVEQIQRGRLIEASRDIAHQLHAARRNARNSGLPVLVRADPAERTFSIVTDRDRRLTVGDVESAAEVWFELPSGVHFVGPEGRPATTQDPSGMVDGLTPIPRTLLPVAVFEPDGTVRNSGAFRIADDRPGRRNVFEIRVHAKGDEVEVAKLIYDGPFGLTSFVPYGDGRWQWY